MLSRVHDRYTVTHTDGKTDSVTAELKAGQDAALAAFLFCDEQQRTGMGFGELSTLLDVARQLTSSLERSGNVEAAKAAVNASVFLKTAGAYKKRAKASSSDDRYDDAAVDLMRAALRPGIDPQALEAVEKDLGIALRDLKEQREVEAKEEAERAAQIAREEAEREATEVGLVVKLMPQIDAYLARVLLALLNNLVVLNGPCFRRRRDSKPKTKLIGPRGKAKKRLRWRAWWTTFPTQAKRTRRLTRSCPRCSSCSPLHPPEVNPPKNRCEQRSVKAKTPKQQRLAFASPTA